MRKALVLGSALAFALKILGSACTLAFNILLARMLGADWTGVYFMALTVVTLTVVLARGGLDIAATRFVATYALEGRHGAVRSLVLAGAGRTLVYAAALTGLVILAGPWVAHVFSEARLTAPLRVMAWSVPPMALGWYFAGVLRGLGRISASQLTEVVLVPLISLLGTVLLAPRLGVQGASHAFVFASIIVAAYGFYQCVDWMRKNPADDSRHEPDALRKASIPLLWGEFIQSMLLWMPSLALSVWASATDVAVFQAASRTAILISFIIMAVRNVVTPKIAQMHSRGETADLQRLIRHADNLATLAALPLWLGLMLFPAVIMGFFGAAYVPYASVLSIVCAGQVVCVMTGCAHPLLQMTGHERVLRELLVYTFFFSVLVNIILVRLYGVYGGATAMALTWALTHAVCTVLVYRRLGIVCCALVPLRHLPPSST